MYSRELVIQLREWKSRRNHKPLVLRGARQVGKTTLVKEFGKEFDVFIYLNLEKKDAGIFQHFDRANDIWQYLQLKHHVTQIKDTSILLFIDEIQEEPKAVSMLRYFYEELPWLHVIAAGSRLQSLLKKRVSFPVGRVEYLSLRPFSFVEYIHVFENEEWQQMLKNQAVPSFLHDDMMRHFNQYALIGGMPEAIAEFATTNSIERLSPIFHSLIKGYNEDAEKYAKNEEQVRILRHILSTVWNTTSQTVTFGQFGNSSYTSTQIHDGMDLLEKAFLLSLDYPITTTSAPAIPAKRRSPKLIMLDSGLTNFMAGIQTEFLLNKDLLDTWRGKAAEQIVAQELRIVL
ncbi:MAG: ATP-binding protein, partial [Prevotella sp.]|nr:ATP-binding protein [Prevotella sp.]